VSFNIHADAHGTQLDAGDVFISLSDKLKNNSWALNDEIIADQDTLTGKYRKICSEIFQSKSFANYVLFQMLLFSWSRGPKACRVCVLYILEICQCSKCQLG